MSKNLPPEVRAEATARSSLVFTLTRVEEMTLRALVAYGESLMSVLRAQRASGEMPASLDKAIAAYGNRIAAHAMGTETACVQVIGFAERDVLEAEVRGTVGLMGQGEIVGRALAFLGGLDPDALEKTIDGADLDLVVVPEVGPCPDCAARRVRLAVAHACASCHGSGVAPTVIPPADRVRTREDFDKIRARMGIAPRSGLVGVDGAPIKRPS